MEEIAILNKFGYSFEESDIEYVRCLKSEHLSIRDVQYVLQNLAEVTETSCIQLKNLVKYVSPEFAVSLLNKHTSEDIEHVIELLDQGLPIGKTHIVLNSDEYYKNKMLLEYENLFKQWKKTGYSSHLDLLCQKHRELNIADINIKSKGLIRNEYVDVYYDLRAIGATLYYDEDMEILLKNLYRYRFSSGNIKKMILIQKIISTTWVTKFWVVPRIMIMLKKYSTVSYEDILIDIFYKGAL